MTTTVNAEHNPTNWQETGSQTANGFLSSGLSKTRSFIRRLLRRDIHITACAVQAGDDIVVSLPDRLDSDDAIALLNALKEQFCGVRIHLLTGFGQVQVQRNDGAHCRERSNDGSNPPLPVLSPAVSNPMLEAAKACPQGDVVVITVATSLRLVAVYIPPKQKCDAVVEPSFHGLVPPVANGSRAGGKHD